MNNRMDADLVGPTRWSMNSQSKLLLFAALSILPSFVKIFFYRILFNAKIGRNVRIGFCTVLCFNELSLDSNVRIGHFNFIRVSALSIGKRGRIGSFSRISCHAVLLGSAATIASWVSILADHRNPQTRFEAGSESWIFDYCYINPARPIKLGRNVGVGGGSYMFTHGLWLSKLDGYPIAHGPITIDNDVWLPWGCFIMPNVSIGSGVVVGARSLVTKSLPAGVFAAGSPAQIVRAVAATPLTIPDKNAVLLDATKEFASSIGQKLSVKESDKWFFCSIADQLLMILAKDEGSTTFPPADRSEMCLVHSGYSKAAESHARVFSLTTYQCCSSDKIGDLQKSWLGHLRLIGLRYYPIDEVWVEA